MNVVNHKNLLNYKVIESIISVLKILCEPNLLQRCYFSFTIGLCLFCRFSISLALYISTLRCYVKLHHKNGYLGNSRILGTWNLDLLRSNHRMIMLQSFQVFLLLLLLAYGSLWSIGSLNIWLVSYIIVTAFCWCTCSHFLNFIVP